MLISMRHGTIQLSQGHPRMEARTLAVFVYKVDISTCAYAWCTSPTRFSIVEYMTCCTGKLFGTSV